MPPRLRRAAPALAVLLISATAPAAASADTVVVGNQIVQGFQCVGPPCANGEAMSGLKIFEKSDDTPGVRLAQGTGSGFAAQTWDVAGNEANFFIRDLTGGSKLPFRIRPGAPTSSIDIGATGEVSTAGVVQQSVIGLPAPVDAIDGDAALAALRTLTLSHYTIGGATHALPAADAFRGAFGVGGTDNAVAAQDIATIALAAVKALDARVSTLVLTPGPAGTKGANGANGATGPTGATGPVGASADLTAATARIATLERTNKSMAKSLATLQKQVRKLTAAAKTKAKARKASATGVRNGR